MKKSFFFAALALPFLAGGLSAGAPAPRIDASMAAVRQGPRVLVLYDGPDEERKPGRSHAPFPPNLPGHFPPRREIQSLDTYAPGSYKRFDAVFCVVYRPRYTVP